MMKNFTLTLFMLMSYIALAQPTSAPPTPSEAQVDVVSIFSDAYTGNPMLTATTFGENNNTAQVVNEAGNDVYEFTIVDGDFQGFQLDAAADLSAMENLHYDLWIEGNISVGAVFNTTVSYHKDGHLTGQTVGYVHTNPTFSSGQEGQWLSFDIPFSDFSPNLASGAKDIISELVFTFTNLTDSGPLYIDNVYFWRESVDPNADATLSDLLVDGITIDGFSSTVFSYDVELPNGTTTVPAVTATATQPTATVDITDASAIPGTTTVLVTAPNGTDTETYTVNFTEEPPLPISPAPTPPARDANDVVSLYSDAYTTVSLPGGVNTFAGATLDDVTIQGNNTLRLEGAPGAGFQYGLGIPNGVDLTDFTFYHIDFYVVGSVVGGEVLTSQLQNFLSNSAFDENIFISSGVSGTDAWVSVDVELSTFNAEGDASRDNIGQLQLILQGPEYGPVYIDNIYFHKNTSLSTNKFNVDTFKVYPNPSNNEWNIESNGQIINSVQVVNMLGKSVINRTVNSKSVKVDATTLPSGLYFAMVEGEKGTKSIQLLKQ